jgi:hypothetical protein
LRVGETIAQCDDRYGKPVEVTSDLRVYHKEQMVIGVFHENGVCWKIAYAHADGTPLSEVERNAILDLYGQWREYENLDSRVGTIWTLNEKHLAAFIDNTRSDRGIGTKGLCIYDRRTQIRKGIEEEANAKAKAILDGL